MFCLGLFFYLRSEDIYQEYLATFSWAPIVLIMLIFAGGQLGFSPIIKVRWKVIYEGLKGFPIY